MLNHIAPTVLISMVKLILVVTISLGFSSWWMYNSPKYADTVVESCSNPNVGDCYSFCDNSTTVVSLTLSDDDILFDDAYKEIQRIKHDLEQEYCIANMDGVCAYNYWMIFKLAPVLLHTLQFAMQCAAWYYFENFTPQEHTFEIILAHQYPHMQRPVASISSGTAPMIKGGSSVMSMIVELVNPPFFSIFAFIEMLTSLYVWGELLYPAVYCGGVRPLSLFYYPVFMCMAELMKFNMYVCIRYLRMGEYCAGALALMNFEYFASNFWISLILALVFAARLVLECCGAVCWVGQQVCYMAIGARPRWPDATGETEPDSPTMNPLGSHRHIQNDPENVDGIRLSDRHTLSKSGVTCASERLDAIAKERMSSHDIL